MITSRDNERLKLLRKLHERSWRDKLGLKVILSEVVNGGTVKLTHLDLGNTHLQLVEPLVPNHPIRDWLEKNGPGLHHFCLKVGDVGEAMAQLPGAGVATGKAPHQGTQGKRALFLDASSTHGVLVEITGK